ncbi:MAG: hypothetical protein JWN53_2163 [Gemmatimonadetes bacterium]|jgi:hypothetical protein|nr:hypothetical protein [Gemmatimonadota bacterium]
MRRRSEPLSLLSALPLIVLTGGAVQQAPMTTSTGAMGGVKICHHAGPRQQVEITVSAADVPWHVMLHGDTVGRCGGVPM